MRLTHILIAAILGLYSPISFGLAISGTPSGVSAYDPGTSTTSTGTGTTVTNTTPTIYGGIAGGESDNSCATKNGTTTCNNCGSGSIAACNTTRVYDNLTMTIPLSDYGNTGVARVKLTDNSTVIGSATSISAVTLTWGELCVAAGLTTCDTDKNVNATIWIDDGDQIFESNEPNMAVIFSVMGATTLSTGINECTTARGNGESGVCYFRAYPGDQKIYIIDAESSGSFPTVGSRKISKLRFFLSSTNWDNALPGRAEHEIDLTLDSSGTITDRRLRGLENGIGYFVRGGTVDVANNLDAITNNANIISSTADCGGTTTTAPAAGLNCKYYAKPDEVLGLLSEDMNCFIATAAYGSQTAEYLDLLREFRFQKLIPTELGRKFVYQYYKYGPYAAQFITEHPWMKPFAQVALWPVISFSWLTLKYGWSIAIGIYVIGMLIALNVFTLAYRKLRQGFVRAQ